MKRIIEMILVFALLCAALPASAQQLATGEYTGGEYTATGDDESAIDVSGSAAVTLTGAQVSKPSGDASSADAASFRGINSAVRVYDGAALTISDCDISADARNATGVFAYDSGVINISDCTINVTGGGAGGVQVAGGGALCGSNLTVTSASKAAIRSDRGGGMLSLYGGTYTSTGKSGCPAIYSTADISVQNATCVSEQSRAVIIEGKNSVTLENCELSGNDQSTKAGSVHANVLLYQSASGDAGEGVSVFNMTGGSMRCASGAMFYCTNTSSAINLCGATLELSESGELLTVSAGRWGKEGKNGGDCAFSADSQTLEGDIYVDSISKLQLALTDSTFTGAIRSDGETSVALDATSRWVLSGDSSITAFEGDTANIDLNGYTLRIGGEVFAAQ